MKFDRYINIGEQVKELENSAVDEGLILCKKGHPFIIRGAALSMPAVQKWTSQYLSTTFGDQLVDIYVAVDNFFVGGQGPYDESKIRLVQMPLNEFLDRIEKRNSKYPFILHERERYYLYQFNVDHLPTLLQDFKIPLVTENYIEQIEKIPNCNLWISENGNFTPPHSDGWRDNFLVQIHGKKEILLWSPDQAKSLYLHPFGHPFARQSAVDLRKVDLQMFPEVQKAQAVKAEIESGDVIFIPEGWIHAVISTEFSISINYWFVKEEQKKLIEDYKLLLKSYSKDLRKQYLHLLNWPETILNKW